MVEGATLRSFMTGRPGFSPWPGPCVAQVWFAPSLTECLPEISHESLGSSQCLLEYLLNRLHSGSGRVKLKVSPSGSRGLRGR